MTHHTLRVAVVMPVFNEEHRIEGFLRRIDLRSVTSSAIIVCVNDASTDSSVNLIAGLREPHHQIHVVHHHANLGHGPSTLRALQEGISQGADWIISVDGDGRISAEAIQDFAIRAADSHCDVVEGHRGTHSASLYRRVVSWSLPLLLFTRARSWTSDANTPFRAYRRSSLAQLLEMIPHQSLIPNLWMSLVVRRIGLNVQTLAIDSDGSSDDGSSGSTWAGTRRSRQLPSRKFVSFCIAAIEEWHREWTSVRENIRRSTNAQ